MICFLIYVSVNIIDVTMIKLNRWDLEAMETLPEYMRICYMALYNTTNEICYKVLKDTGRIVLPYLKSTVINLSIKITNQCLKLCAN